MARPSNKFAESLDALRALQDQGVQAIQASQLSRTHRERLLAAGFLAEVLKGWYIPARPDETRGESTAWYASFWAFCARYLDERFGNAWCLGPEQSLALITGDWTVPRQLMVRSPTGGNKPLQLPHQTSLFDIRAALPAADDIEVQEGIRRYSLPAALVASSPTAFQTAPVTLKTALAMVSNGSALLRHLLEGEHSTIAGRLAGALRHQGNTALANEIVDTMRAAGYPVRESNPFDGVPETDTTALQAGSPHVNRLRLNWARMREGVLAHFPPPPDRRPGKQHYLDQVDDSYVTDAYHSLSIEGYRVSPELIERVRSGAWNPDEFREDQRHRDALAARGYWQAFQQVRQSLERILDGANPGAIVQQNHGHWYRALFAPSVQAGILRPAELAGYRNSPVYIRRSKHVPPRPAAVHELMSAFFQQLQEEASPAVRVVLGHFFFVHIHPYIDGNGRMGRFMMNAMLAAGGYPWVVVPLEKRNAYMEALEAASVDGDIVPFTRFIGALVGRA